MKHNLKKWINIHIETIIKGGHVTNKTNSNFSRLGRRPAKDRSPSLILAVLLSLIISLALAGCGKNKSYPANPNPTPGIGLYVSPTGNDNNAGSDQEPLRTLQAAIDQAAVGGEITSVYVAAGTYSQIRPLELKSKVRLMGGYNAGDWTRDIQANRTVIIGQPDSITIHGYRADSVIIDGFTIIGADASETRPVTPGNNSIAIALDSCLMVLISHDSITTGIASAGAIGVTGTSGAIGWAGTAGENAGGCPNAGGSGGNNYYPGGSGGRGGDFGGFSGADGSGPYGGTGGEGGVTGQDGSFGWYGGSGNIGAHGVGGLGFGHLDRIIYVPSNGTTGGQGTDGSGGGGGGGGGGGVIGFCGGGGGGGGGGGHYGLGGGSGYGGGASIGIIVANGSNTIIDTNTIVTDNGGDGGAGGPGGSGGNGGSGGSGGASGFGGAGGDGGSGGFGGAGAPGGGGGGGPTIGILEDASSITVRWNNNITLGDPGTGGSHGQANTGADGVQQEYRKLN